MSSEQKTTRRGPSIADGRRIAAWRFALLYDLYRRLGACRRSVPARPVPRTVQVERRSLKVYARAAR